MLSKYRPSGQHRNRYKEQLNSVEAQQSLVAIYEIELELLIRPSLEEAFDIYRSVPPTILICAEHPNVAFVALQLPLTLHLCVFIVEYGLYPDGLIPTCFRTWGSGGFHHEPDAGSGLEIISYADLSRYE